MSLSCSVLPDFYPGDDVLQFDLRLTPPSSHDDEKHCFCLQGHSCDPRWESRRRDGGNLACADSSTVLNINDYKEKKSVRYAWLDRFYAFILPSVTKWDAARFLTLSVDPWARYPLQWPLEEECITNENQTDDQTCNNKSPADNEKRFHPSEQSHAFFPSLPLAIRYSANFLVKVTPSNILLPPTYEATVALSSIVINMFAFVIAALSLYDLTIFILKRDALEKNWNSTKNSAHKQPKNEASHHLLAKTTAQLFCINPAGVFFTTAYSESVFAMLTFLGHAIFARGQYYGMEAQEPQRRKASQHGWRANLYWIVSTILWMLASYTRSNGTFSSIWLVLAGVSKCCSCIITNHQESKAKSTTKVFFKCISSLLFHAMLALFVIYPVFYHDRRGYKFHCLEPIQYPASQPYRFPAWCEHGEIGHGFSLYALVQRKHWNVGLFRYYEMKQIPNFVLALPVLSLSFTSAAVWIKLSWDRHLPNGVERGPFKGCCIFAKHAFTWAFRALGNSSHDFVSCRQQDEEGNKNTGSSIAALDGLLLGSKFLSYNAILAGFAIVGTFLAHVQISTRLICSSCPAFYWFSSAIVAPFALSKHRENGGIHGPASQTQILLYSYFALYNILGVIMHVNWLPWT
ncbi:hypothetical protein ACHAXR_002498 [Thalassiosira sp. AJA248-18]